MCRTLPPDENTSKSNCFYLWESELLTPSPLLYHLERYSRCLWRHFEIIRIRCHRSMWPRCFLPWGQRHLSSTGRVCLPVVDCRLTGLVCCLVESFAALRHFSEPLLLPCILQSSFCFWTKSDRKTRKVSTDINIYTRSLTSCQIIYWDYNFSAGESVYELKLLTEYYIIDGWVKKT